MFFAGLMFSFAGGWLMATSGMFFPGWCIALAGMGLAISATSKG